MKMQVGIGANQRTTLSQTLSPQMREGLRLLHMNALELATEIRHEIDANPVLDYDESDTPVLSAIEKKAKEREATHAEEIPEDESAPSYNASEDAIERRERLFERQVVTETLQDHLLAQVSLSDIPSADRVLAEFLIGEINDDGRFTGSMADIMMVTGASEKRINAVLRRILKFDPPGCGGRTIPEILAAQLDRLDDDPWQDEVRRIIVKYWDDFSNGRHETVRSALGLTTEEYAKVVSSLRQLTPWPGRGFSVKETNVEYVRPEIQAVFRDGRWVAEMDDGDLPEIRISPRYRRMLEDDSVTAEVKSYVRERIRAAEAFRDTIARRRETIQAIAQAIIDAQPEFFKCGLVGLKPLTMKDIAAKTNVHETTVSRTVNAKYIATPRGTVGLKVFFVKGFKDESGESVTRDAVAERIRAIIDSEDVSSPLADEKIAAMLSAEGLKVARRTVAKYRDQLGIPGTSARRKK